MTIPACLFFPTLGALMFAVAWYARAAGKRRTEGWITLGAGISYSVVFWGITWVFTDVQRKVTVPADWRFEQRGSQRILVVDTGNGFGGFYIHSAQLEQDLEKTKPTKVQVTLTCIYDFGKLRACGPPEQVDGIAVTALTDGSSPPPSAPVKEQGQH
jgi:hypothetical protein